MEAHPDSASTGTFHAFTKPFQPGENGPGFIKRSPCLFPGAAPQKTAQELQPGSGLRPYGTGRLGSLQIGIVHFYGQPRTRRRPTGRKHKPPRQKERSSPSSAVPPLPCIDGPAFALPADCPQAAAPSFFPEGCLLGWVGPHHHGIRERFRLHHGNVQRHVLHDFFLTIFVNQSTYFHGFNYFSIDNSRKSYHQSHDTDKKGREKLAESHRKGL